MREEQEIRSTNPDLPIQKKVLHPGKGELPQYADGTKVKFHFVAKLLDDDGTVLDDSRKWPQPMELIFGKKFKLESWEMSIRTMLIGEVASFKTKRIYTHSYPLVAKTLRETYGPKKPGHSHAPKSSHVCGMAMAAGGLGFDDLNKLMKSPEDLEFVIELLSVDNSYEKESWQMDADEKLDSVPLLKTEGNQLFKEKKYTQAGDKYKDALGRLEQLMLREKPGEDEWNQLLQLKIPLLLNLSQCKLNEEDYYSVIDYTTEVLEHEEKSVKALFRRGKAHIGAWNPAAAKSDFLQVLELDPSLAGTCRKELSKIENAEKQKDEEDRKKFDKLFI